MGYISQDQLIGGYSQMNPQQINFINAFFAKFNNGGAHQTILNVEPLYYIGSSIGSEFLNYNATKLYLALNYQLSANITLSVTGQKIDFYNELNNLEMSLANNVILYDTVNSLIQCANNNVEQNNFYFSRFAMQNIDYFIFNGYRITLN
jgi:hypothetical protein